MPINSVAFTSGDAPELTPSGMTVGEMVQHAYFLADEQPNVVFGDADVLRLVNMGMRKVVDAYGYPERTAAVLVKAGTQPPALVDAAANGNRHVHVVAMYLLSSDASVVSGTLSRVDPIYTDSSTGTPTSYWIEGDKITLSPTPSADCVISVVYKSQLPTYVDLSAVPPLTDPQQEAAIFYAVWQMKLKDQQNSSADRWYAEYQSAIKSISSITAGVYKYGG